MEVILETMRFLLGLIQPGKKFRSILICWRFNVRSSLGKRINQSSFEMGDVYVRHYFNGC